MTQPVAPLENFYAIIPAGGAGTRLWPLSRRSAPKFLLDLTGTGRSLLQSTVDRLLPLTGAEGIYVVTGENHVSGVLDQLDISGDHIIAEPSPMDSMAAIGLAAAVLQERHGPVVIGSFAADQVITGRSAFEESVRQAVAAASEGYVVTVGIAASRPSVAFGYIHTGQLLGLQGAPEARSVRSFTEKPDALTAQRYLSTGEYRWNGGMFVVRTDILLGHLAQRRPKLHAGLLEIAQAWDTENRVEVLGRVWPTLERISIDHALAEPVAADGGLVTIPGHFGWDDVGDFNSLAGLLPAVDGAGNKVLGDVDQIVRIDSAGSVIVPGGGRLVTVLGLDDVVVVDTPDAVLVTTRARAQQVKELVARLVATGHQDQV